jgi:hypothetical protein
MSDVRLQNDDLTYLVQAVQMRQSSMAKPGIA